MITVVENQATLSKNDGLGKAHPQKQLAVVIKKKTTLYVYPYAYTEQNDVWYNMKASVVFLSCWFKKKIILH